jgi:hypothetical protein
MQQASLSRRTFIRGAAGAAAGLGVGAGLPRSAAAGHEHDHGADPAASVPPKPIAAGFQIPGGPFLHVRAPGPPGVVLPFTQVPLEGFDVEPSTLTDFRGFSALAYHVGTATGRDGTAFNLETDLRAFEGAYVDAHGTRRFGKFALI